MSQAPMAARRAVSRRCSADWSDVMARKNGTAANGSTTTKMADSATRLWVRTSRSIGLPDPAPRQRKFERRMDHTLRSASRTIRFDIFDCPTRRSTKTMGISLTRKPRRRVR